MNIKTMVNINQLDDNQIKQINKINQINSENSMNHSSNQLSNDLSDAYKIPVSHCVLCREGSLESGGELIFNGKYLRLIRSDELNLPAFYRLIWQKHVVEMSDLNRSDRYLCLDALHEIELSLRYHLKPNKINLASFGNVVPHLHWHIIARFDWDSHFPAPIWVTETQRTASKSKINKIISKRAALHLDLQQRLSDF